MVSCPLHGSGIIISIACGSERPAITSSSSTLSNMAESLPPSPMIGQDLLEVVAEERRLEQSASRACIQLMLPRSVLISPLWAM